MGRARHGCQLCPTNAERDGATGGCVCVVGFEVNAAGNACEPAEEAEQQEAFANLGAQKPTNPQCTLKQFDLVVEVNAEPLKGRLCDELNEGDRAKASSVVLTVLRPTVSVDQLLRAAAKLARQKGTSSTSSSPSSSRARDSAREAGTRSAPSGRRPPRDGEL